MIRKYHTHKLLTNSWHREEKQHNNHETHEDKLTKATSSCITIKMIAKPERTQIVEEPGFKNVKNKHLGMSPF